MSNIQHNNKQLKVYIEKSKKHKPQLVEQKNKKETSQIVKTITQYLVNPNLVIKNDQNIILGQRQLQKRLYEYYTIYSSQNESNLDFLQFIQYWTQKDQSIYITYNQKSNENQPVQNQYNLQSKEQNKQQQIKINQSQIEQNKKLNTNRQQIKNSQSNQKDSYQNQNMCQKQEQNLEGQKESDQNKSLQISIQKSNNLKKKEKTNNINKNIDKNKYKFKEIENKNQVIYEIGLENLKFLHRHYCRKFIALPKDQSFSELQHYYMTLNLTQFIAFARQMNLLNQKFYKSQDDAQQNSPIKQMQSPKYIKQNRMDSQFFKYIFQRHSKQFVMSFQNFVEGIKQVLVYSHGVYTLNLEAFKLLNIDNQTNFKKVLAKIGQYLPSNQVLVQNLSKNQLTPKTPKIVLKTPKIQKHYENAKQEDQDKNRKQKIVDLPNKKKFYRNREQKIQEQLLQRMSLQNLRKFKISKQIENHLCQIIGSNLNLNQQSSTSRIKVNKTKNAMIKKHNSNTQHQGIIKRLQKRISNVINKVR